MHGGDMYRHNINILVLLTALTPKTNNIYFLKLRKDKNERNVFSSNTLNKYTKHKQQTDRQTTNILQRKPLIYTCKDRFTK